MNCLSRDIYLNYAASYPNLNRLSDKRKYDDWFNVTLNDDSTRFIPVWQTKNLISILKMKAPKGVILSKHDLRLLNVRWDSAVLLGEMNGTIYFGVEVLFEDERDSDKISSLGMFCNLKEQAPLMSSHECGLLSYARLMIDWHRRNRYCGVCGYPTRSVESGHVLECTRETCRKQHFPRTDMAIIVLVTNEEACLLARQPLWPPKLYSILAGFVEPAENFEDAVRREVFEEAGLELSHMQYVTSQPWPFSNSIMIGYTAESVDKNYTLDHEELENVLWVTRKDIKKDVQKENLVLPSVTSVSYYLIERWFDAGNQGSLKDLTGKIQHLK